MNTAEILKDLRESRGLSQEQLAKIIGVDRTTIVKYETGASRPTRHITKIAHYFGVTTDYLLGNETINQKPSLILSPSEQENIEKYRALTPNLLNLEDMKHHLKPEDQEALELALKIKDSPKIRKLVEDIIKMFSPQKPHTKK